MSISHTVLSNITIIYFQTFPLFPTTVQAIHQPVRATCFPAAHVNGKYHYLHFFFLSLDSHFLFIYLKISGCALALTPSDKPMSSLKATQLVLYTFSNHLSLYFPHSFAFFLSHSLFVFGRQEKVGLRVLLVSRYVFLPFFFFPRLVKLHACEWLFLTCGICR